MSVATKLAKAKRMGVVFEEDYAPKDEAELDKIIDAKQELLDQEKQEEKIRKENEKKAAEHAKKHILVLRDVDGDDVDQSEYFFPREVKETVKDASNKDVVLEPTDQTAPFYFNQSNGYPVDREELIEEFVKHFPRSKGFLFYKKRESEVYIIIVPLKYATRINRSNDSRPGDFQRHALSFIQEGSVNVDSLRLKLARIAKHSAISPDPIAR